MRRAQGRAGDRLRALARRFCTCDTMDRVVDPLIADMRFESNESQRAGRPWQARRRRAAGYLAFWRTIGFCAARAALGSARRWANAEGHVMGRTLGYAAGIIAALVFCLALLPFYAVTSANRVAPHELGKLFLYVVPQAIPLAIAFGLPLGILMGLRGRSTDSRIRWSVVAVCIVSTLVAFGICGWVLPETNQAFRETVVRSRRPLARGANELTFPELNAQLEALQRVGRTDAARHLVYSYHARLAASAAPFIWGLFALALASVTRRTFLSAAIFVVAGITYIACAVAIINGGVETFRGLPIAYTIWLPNVCFALMTIALRVGASKSA